MLPVLSRTLRASEAATVSEAADGKRMSAALRRRARVAQKYAHTQEHGAVFKVCAWFLIAWPENQTRQSLYHLCISQA